MSTIGESERNVVDPILEKIKVAANNDPVMKKLRYTIIQGLPNDKCNLEDNIRPFWNIRHQLAIDDTDNMTVVGARIVIPKQM